MGKGIREQDFFNREADKVAKDLLGKSIWRKGKKEKYLIIETEAYFHDEDFCYGYGKTKDEAQKLTSAPLFERPGTWCIYGGQLLLSVKDDKSSDNVLVKRIRTEKGEILGPDGMAFVLNLYKSKTDYCGCHGQYSLSDDSFLCLEDGQEVTKVICTKRVNIKSDKELNFRSDCN